MKKKSDKTRKEVRSLIEHRIDKFLFKMEYPYQVTEETPNFIKKKILPLLKRTEDSLTLIDTETFIGILEGQMAKEATPMKMVKYLSLMQESVSYFDTIFFRYKEKNK